MHSTSDNIEKGRESHSKTDKNTETMNRYLNESFSSSSSSSDDELTSSESEAEDEKSDPIRSSKYTRLSITSMPMENIIFKILNREVSLEKS